MFIEVEVDCTNRVFFTCKTTPKMLVNSDAIMSVQQEADTGLSVINLKDGSQLFVKDSYEKLRFMLVGVLIAKGEPDGRTSAV